MPEAKCTSGIIRIAATLYEVKYLRKVVLFGIEVQFKENARMTLYIKAQCFQKSERIVNGGQCFPKSSTVTVAVGHDKLVRERVQQRLLRDFNILADHFASGRGLTGRWMRRR